MSVAFLTMVWRDYWLLEKWVAHNAAMVPKRHLYVINHGGDPEIDRIADGCNVIHVPRDGVTLDLTSRRWDLVSGITNGLLAFHDWVIPTDVDELLVHIGDDPGGLVGHLGQVQTGLAALALLGLNLMPTPDDPDDADLPVLRRVPNAMLSGKYSKPCIVRSRVIYSLGGHGLLRSKFEIDPEILLIHLHYATPDYSERMAARRDIVADARARNDASATKIEVTGHHWINWSKPDRIRDKDIAAFGRAVAIDATDGFRASAELVRAKLRQKGKKMLVDDVEIDGKAVRLVIPESLRDRI